MKGSRQGWEGDGREESGGRARKGQGKGKGRKEMGKGQENVTWEEREQAIRRTRREKQTTCHLTCCCAWLFAPHAWLSAPSCKVGALQDKIKQECVDGHSLPWFVAAFCKLRGMRGSRGGGGRSLQETLFGLCNASSQSKNKRQNKRRGAHSMLCPFHCVQVLRDKQEARGCVPG